MQALTLLICGLAFAAPDTDSTDVSSGDRQVQASLFGPILHEPVGWGAAAQRRQLVGIQSHLDQADARLLELTDVSREQLQLQSLLGHLTQGRSIPRENMEAMFRQLDRREQAAVAELARSFQKAAYQAFPRDAEQRERRIDASQGMFDAWRDAGSPPEQLARLAAWLLEAIAATQPSHTTELPPPPTFETTIERMGSGNLGPLSTPTPSPVSPPEPLSTPALSEPIDQISAEMPSDTPPGRGRFDTVVRLGAPSHLAPRKPLPLDRADRQPSQERLTRSEPIGLTLSCASVGQLSSLSQSTPPEHPIPAALDNSNEPYAIVNPAPTVVPLGQELAVTQTTNAWVPMPQSGKVRCEQTVNLPEPRGVLKGTLLSFQRVSPTEARAMAKPDHPTSAALPVRHRSTPIRLQADLVAEPLREESPWMTPEPHSAIRADALVASSEPARIEDRLLAPVGRFQTRPETEPLTRIPVPAASARFRPSDDASTAYRPDRSLQIARSRGPVPGPRLFDGVASPAASSSSGVGAKTERPLTLVSYVATEQVPVRRTIEAPSEFYHARIDGADVTLGPSPVLGLKGERPAANVDGFPRTLGKNTTSPRPIARRPLEFDLEMAVLTDESRYLPSEPVSFINLEELQSRIAGCNLELRELEAELDAPANRVTDHLAAILSELQLLIARQGDLGLLYDLVPEYRRSELGKINSTRPILARLNARIASARETAQSVGQSDSQSDLFVLEELSRVVADLTAEP